MLEQWLYRGSIQDVYGEVSFYIVQSSLDLSSLPSPNNSWLKLNREITIIDMSEMYYNHYTVHIVFHTDFASIAQFMVRENQRISREPVETSGFFDADNVQSYWEGRHTLHPPNIPSFLARDADRVLSAGKYLNVVRHCITRARAHSGAGAGATGGGAALSSPAAAQAAKRAPASPDKLAGTLWDGDTADEVQTEEAEADEELVVPRAAALAYTRCDAVSSDLERAIEPAYQFAADRLIQLLMRQYDLAARFRYSQTVSSF